MISQHLLVLRNLFTCEVTETLSTQYPLVKFRERVQELCSTQLIDGGWSDCDLSLAVEEGAVIAEYMQRMLILACDYRRHRHVESLRTLTKALELWYQEPRQSWNWWWNDIGRQRWLGPIALLTCDVLPPYLLTKVLDDMPQTPKRTGANLSDYCHGMAMGALLEGNTKRLSTALEAMTSTIKITKEEGIQVDYSYQQHGPQIYNGGYGESFLNCVLLWAYLTHDTPFTFARPVQKTLLDYYLNGTMWMTRHGVFDFNVCGRSVSKPLLEKPFGGQQLTGQGKHLATLFPEQRSLISAFLLHVGDEPHPLTGFRYFWCSDYGVKVTANYSVSVKMNSNRIKPIETGNQENLLGYWLGFGSMNISRNGSEYRDIFPNWDWSKIPGVTCPEIEMGTVEWGQIEQETSWAGGVTSGHVGITTFELGCQKTQALKSWFMFDDVIVALGAGITSTHEQPIHTSVNQCHLSEKVIADGHPVTDRRLIGKPLRWLHHDHIGYVFDGVMPLDLKCENRVDNWNRINANLDIEAESSVFQLSINHGVSPTNQTYQYHCDFLQR